MKRGAKQTSKQKGTLITIESRILWLQISGMLDTIKNIFRGSEQLLKQVFLMLGKTIYTKSTETPTSQEFSSFGGGREK